MHCDFLHVYADIAFAVLHRDSCTITYEVTYADAASDIDSEEELNNFLAVIELNVQSTIDESLPPELAGRTVDTEATENANADLLESGKTIIQNEFSDLKVCLLFCVPILKSFYLARTEYILGPF